MSAPSPGARPAAGAAGAAERFTDIFTTIRARFARHAAKGIVLHDEPARYYLGTHEVRARDGYRTWLGGVEIKRSYVSVHLIPVYVHPALLDGTSEPLRRRMHGKSCFNFRTLDPVLLDELAGLIDRGVDRFVRDCRLGPGGEAAG